MSQTQWIKTTMINFTFYNIWGHNIKTWGHYDLAAFGCKKPFQKNSSADYILRMEVLSLTLL